MINRNKNDSVLLDDKNVYFFDKVYNDYPEFDAISFASLISFFLKQYDLDYLIQDFEINFLRKNDFKLKNFIAFKQVLIKELQNSPTKNDNWGFLKQVILKIGDEFDKHKSMIEQYKQSNDEYLEKKHNMYNTLISVINNDIKTYKEKLSKDDKKQQLQQSFDDCNNNKKTISLSPTQGIMMLNEDPYRFFIEKILGLSSIDNWETTESAKSYGDVIHRIMYNFSKKCQNIENYYDITNKIFYDVALRILNDEDNINSFITSKIEQIADIAVKLEYDAKYYNREVLCEKEFSYIFNGITIKAKADRVEIDHNNKEIYIYDYKTGTNLPKNNEEENGKKTQVSIIAVLMKYCGYKDFNVKKMIYISLSGKEIFNNEDIDTNIIPNVEVNLINMLNFYFTNGVPNIEKMKHIKPLLEYSYQEEKDVNYLSRTTPFC